MAMLLSGLHPALKMAQKGSEPLPYCAVPHQPLSGHRGAVARREVSRWARGSKGSCGEAQGAREGRGAEATQGELTEDTRPSSPDSAAAAP